MSEYEFDEFDQLDRALKSLRYVERRLRLYGQVGFASSLLAFALSVAGFTLSAGRDINFNSRVSFAGAAAALAIGAIVVLAAYDMHLRRGNALYVEVSEEIQYRIQVFRGNRVSGDSATSYRPPIVLRTALNDFTSASTLPLIPGRAGPAILAGFDALVAVLSSVLLLR